MRPAAPQGAAGLFVLKNGQAAADCGADRVCTGR